MAVEISGLDEVLNALKGFDDTSVQNTLNRAFMQAAQSMADQAKQLCRVDQGQLRASIAAEPLPNGADFCATAEHAEYVEYGTGKKGDPSVAHTTKDYWRYKDDDGNWHTTSGMEPAPFMLPSFESGKQEILPTVKKCIREDFNLG